jgi:hypothetical protein
VSAPRRSIYKQDAPGSRDGARPASPSQPGPARTPPPSAPDGKITLILHPAPKAVPAFVKKSEDKPRTAREALQARTSKQQPKGSKPPERGGAPAGVLEPAWIEATSAADALAAAAAAGDALGEALVKAWLERGSAAAIAAVAGADGLPGRTRKAARRGVHVLRARGVSLPQPTGTVEAAPEEGDEPIASFVPPDGSGRAFFSISQRLPGGRYRVADVVVQDAVGIVHASSGELAGKHIRRWRQRVREHFGTEPVTVPVAWARRRVAEGRSLNERSGQILPLGLDACAPLLGPPATEAPHPCADLEEGLGEGAAGSESLHAEPELRGWLPERGALDELLGKVGERLAGAEPTPAKEQVDQALREEIASAVDRYFTPERRVLVAARMRDAAVSVRARAGDDAARRLLAAAGAVEHAGLITSPPSEVPFLLAFFQKGVALMAAQGQGRLQVPVPRGTGT